MRYHAAWNTRLIRAGDKYRLCAMNTVWCVCARYAFCFGFLSLMGRCAPRALDMDSHRELMPSGRRGAGWPHFTTPHTSHCPTGCVSPEEPSCIGTAHRVGNVLVLRSSSSVSDDLSLQQSMPRASGSQQTW